MLTSNAKNGPMSGTSRNMVLMPHFFRGIHCKLRHTFLYLGLDTHRRDEAFPQL